MIIDYLKDGGDECPLIRLRNGQSEDYDILTEAIKNLIKDDKEVDLFSLKGFHKGENIEKITFTKGDVDREISEISRRSFICQFTKENLLNIIEKLESYKISQHGYNWLNDDMGISLLLSYEGTW